MSSSHEGIKRRTEYTIDVTREFIKAQRFFFQAIDYPASYSIVISANPNTLSFSTLQIHDFKPTHLTSCFQNNAISSF